MTTNRFEITDDMVEAGAQALRTAFLIIPPRKGWDQVPAAARHRFRIEARAVLVAAQAAAMKHKAPAT